MDGFLPRCDSFLFDFSSVRLNSFKLCLFSLLRSVQLDSIKRERTLAVVYPTRRGGGGGVWRSSRPDPG